MVRLGELNHQKKHPKKFSCRLAKSTSIRAIDLAVQHIKDFVVLGIFICVWILVDRFWYPAIFVFSYGQDFKCVSISYHLPLSVSE